MSSRYCQCKHILLGAVENPFSTLSRDSCCHAVFSSVRLSSKVPLKEASQPGPGSLPSLWISSVESLLMLSLLLNNRGSLTWGSQKKYHFRGNSVSPKGLGPKSCSHKKYGGCQIPAALPCLWGGRSGSANLADTITLFCNYTNSNNNTLMLLDKASLYHRAAFLASPGRKIEKANTGA